VTSESNRVGLRLDGAALDRTDDRELVSEACCAARCRCRRPACPCCSGRRPRHRWLPGDRLRGRPGRRPLRAAAARAGGALRRVYTRRSTCAPGSVKIRAGGDSPRPDRSQRPVDLVKLRDRR
jgi:hypothetical protein